MILKMDENSWQNLSVRGRGVIILEGYHPAINLDCQVCDSFPRLLGKTSLLNPTCTKLSEIHSADQKVLSEIFKRGEEITLVEAQVIRIERYWCKGCGSVSLTFSTANIKAGPVMYELPFICNRCGLEFYTEGREDVYSRVTFNSLAEEYPPFNMNDILPDEQVVVAVVM